MGDTAGMNASPIGDIVAGLRDDIAAVCRKILPRGRADPPNGASRWILDGADSPFGCSMSVVLRGPKKGLWRAWASEDHGDALDLVARVMCHGDKKEAVKWALDWLGKTPLPDPKERERRETQARREAEDDRQRKGGNAQRIWLNARPSLKGTPAEWYLRNRGIDLAELGRQPRALRFHPALWDDGQMGREWPALVALLNTPEGVGIHRTWLTPDGRKAPLRDPKRSYGAKRGGIIPLWRGASGRPMREAPEGSTLWLSEGIEDGLSIAIMTGGAERVAAAIDLGNMALVTLPPAIGTIVIVGQNDQWWHDNQQRAHGAAVGLDRAIKHFQSEGRQVRVWRPDRADCKDANDLLRATRGERGRVA
jgi:hypothetical protein